MAQVITGPLHYNTSARGRLPLIRFMTEGLEESGSKLLFVSPAERAPFVITFETPEGERMGIVAYAFLANMKETTNRPADEHRFQAKYGSNDKALHHLWQDPLGLYTTMFLGISPSGGFVVSLDPVFHSPLYFYSSYEFKQQHVDEIVANGRASWERVYRGSRTDRRQGRETVNRDDAEVRTGYEVVVACTKDRFLSLVRFERAVKGLDQGNRQLFFEKAFDAGQAAASSGAGVSSVTTAEVAKHPLLEEMRLSSEEIMDVIAQARRLKMAVRGWVAEEHLRRVLEVVEGVTDCIGLDQEGSPDIQLRWRGSAPVHIECKNVLRKTNASGLARIDFQRTRASKGDPCSRYYARDDFDIVAACLHAVTENWEFKVRCTRDLIVHTSCAGKIANNLVVDTEWTDSVANVLTTITGR